MYLFFSLVSLPFCQFMDIIQKLEQIRKRSELPPSSDEQLHKTCPDVRSVNLRDWIWEHCVITREDCAPSLPLARSCPLVEAAAARWQIKEIHAHLLGEKTPTALVSNNSADGVHAELSTPGLAFRKGVGSRSPESPVAGCGLGFE